MGTLIDGLTGSRRFIRHNARLIIVKIANVIKLVNLARLSSGRKIANSKIMPATVTIALMGVAVVGLTFEKHFGSQLWLLMPYRMRDAMMICTNAPLRIDAILMNEMNEESCPVFV